jgi:aromatic-amino-acid transaminase
MIASQTSKTYVGPLGNADFNERITELALGPLARTLRPRIAAIQTVGGCGALRVGAELLRVAAPDAVIHVSTPTWANHEPLVGSSGLALRRYPYYDPANRGVDFERMHAQLSGLPAGAVVLLHACCHNPTGVDLTSAQWDQLIPLLKRRELIAYLDLAYQGYGDGIDEDAYAVRAMASSGAVCVVANSFSKSMSVYGERCGALSVVCPTASEADLVLGQLKLTVRRIYSSPAIHSAGIMALVLGDPQLRPMWEAEVTQMRERIRAMRKALHEVLSARVPGRDFNYLLTQRGMFSYTGLSAAQVDRLREDHAVYLIRSGRMCVAGLNRGNVERTAQAFAAVLAG